MLLVSLQTNHILKWTACSDRKIEKKADMVPSNCQVLPSHKKWMFNARRHTKNYFVGVGKCSPLPCHGNTIMSVCLPKSEPHLFLFGRCLSTFQCNVHCLGSCNICHPWPQVFKWGNSAKHMHFASAVIHAWNGMQMKFKRHAPMGVMYERIEGPGFMLSKSSFMEGLFGLTHESRSKPIL